MKSITSSIAQHSENLSLADFREKYIKEHPQGENLTADNIRQAFAEYNRYCRRFRRNQPKPKT